MASSNIDYNLFFDQYSQNGYRFGSCQAEANRSGNQQSIISHKEVRGSPNVHISTNGYYGHTAIISWNSASDQQEERVMDCEMVPISPRRAAEQRTLGRKRCSDDVNFANFKRFRRDERKTRDKRRKEDARPAKQYSQSEDAFLEDLLRETHGCHMFHFVQ